jgi:hypothetical protein
MSDFTVALQSFIEKASYMIENHIKENYTFVSAGKLEFTEGNRYVKIIKVEASQSRFVWAFVDKKTGDILKPASWKAPAKGVRGNIFNDDPLKGIGPYGPHYLK